MKRAIVLLVVALAIPTGVAFAKSPHRHGKSRPKVMYVLRGTLSSYTAATTAAAGEISITVRHSNFHGRALRGQTLTFSTSMRTRVAFRHGARQITDGARGILRFRAPLRMGAGTDLATALPTMAKALRIVDLSRS